MIVKSQSPEVDHSGGVDHRIRAAPCRPARRQAGPHRRADRPHADVRAARGRRPARGGRPGARAASARATCWRSTARTCPSTRSSSTAVASLGGIITTANPLYTADELAKQLRDSGARFLVTVPPVPRQGEGGRGQGGGVEDDLRLRRGGGRAPVRRAAAGRRPAARGRHRPAQRPRRAAVLERHHRPAQGRDAHPPQPGGEPLPGRGHAELRRASASATSPWPCCRSSTSTAWS